MPYPDQATAPAPYEQGLSRRSAMGLLAGTAVLSTMPNLAFAQLAPAGVRPVRVATGLLATWQSTAWLGAEAGLYKGPQDGKDNKELRDALAKCVLDKKCDPLPQDEQCRPRAM